MALPSLLTAALTAFFPDTPHVFAENIPTTTAMITSSARIAATVNAAFPNPSLALLPQPYWWWESGSTIDALLTYGLSTGDQQYQSLSTSTLLNQATPANNFLTIDATGNDDQAWWALAALTAAESGVAVPAGAPSYLSLAQNVFEEQKARWDTTSCNGGMKWKINVGDGTDGYHYKSSIANGLFFQLAARLGAFTNNTDALAWAEKSYAWVESVGLIDAQYNVFDGTDDQKGPNGCVDVNHNQWSYNAGVFLHGSAIMANHTGGNATWMARTQGFVASVRREFVKDGVLFEAMCEGDGSCDTDQVSFKGALARWMGASAAVLPSVQASIAGLLGTNAAKVQSAWSTSVDFMDQFSGLEIMDAAIRTRGKTVTAAQGMIGASKRSRRVVRKTSIAGRIWWET